MDRDEIEAFVGDVAPDEDIILADGLDEAFLGLAPEMEPPIAVYSETKAIEILSKQGMSRDEAVEYFQYNVVGSLFEGSPMFIETPE